MKLAELQAIQPFTVNFESYAHIGYQLVQRADTNTQDPRLFVQVMDEYSYQRELIISYRHEEKPNHGRWEVHAYRHPNRRRWAKDVDAKVAMHYVDTIIRYSRVFTTLMFNPGKSAGDQYGRCDGFVKFHDFLLDGCTMVKELIE